MTCSLLLSVYTSLTLGNRSREVGQLHSPWAARYNAWLLIRLTPKDIVVSFLLSFIPGQSTRPAYLEDLLHLTLAAEALPSRHHQKSCHLGIGTVSHCQCLVPAWAEPCAGAKVELVSTE